MSKIIILHKNNELISLELQPGKEYVAGRSSEADIKLPNLEGVSRRHFKLKLEEGVLHVEQLAKYGELVIDGELHDNYEAFDSCTIKIRPFEIQYEKDKVDTQQQEQDQKPDDSSDSTENLPANINTYDPNEKTAIGSFSIVLKLIVHYPTGEEDRLSFTEDHLIAGREATCEIYLRDDHISRRHFEIIKKASLYYIRDLGSSNGTYLNETKLSTDKLEAIKSEDQIQIKGLKITVLYEDSSFQQKLSQAISVPAVQQNQMTYQPIFQPPSVEDFEDVAVVGVERLNTSNNKVKKIIGKLFENKVRGTLVVIVGLFLILVMLPSGKKNETAGKKDFASKVPTFKTLTEEEKSLIKHKYKLLHAAYSRADYGVCIVEAKGIHKILPIGFEESKRYHRLCENGLKAIEDLAYREKLEQMREKNEQQITRTINECESKFNKLSLPELKDCLLPALEISPEDAKILSLLERKNAEIEQSKKLEEVAAARKSRIQDGINDYKRHIAPYKKGQLKKAINRLESYLAKSYPDPQNYKQKGRRKLASIEKELNTKINNKLSECENLLGKEKYQEAYNACESALKEDKENKSAQAMIKKLRYELSLKMKKLFDNAILEENYGNVTAAKKLWKTILEQDFPQGSEFHEKAKIRLSKYGE